MKFSSASTIIRVNCSEFRLIGKHKVVAGFRRNFHQSRTSSTQRISNCKIGKLNFYPFVKSKNLLTFMCVCCRKSFIILCPCSIRYYLKPFIDFSEIVEIKEAFLGEKIMIVIFLKRKSQ